MKLKLTVAALDAMLTVPAMAGTPVVTETPAPTPAPAPEPIAFEVGAFYSFPTKDIISWGPGFAGKKVHMLGGDITSVYQIDDSSSATIRLGYGTGSASRHDGWGRDRYRLHTFTLAPGYRYSVKVDDAVTCFAGASAGVSNSSLKYKYTWPTGRDSAHGSEWGFVYSAEVGVSYAVSQDVSVFLAYEFSGNTARPRLNNGYNKSANQQVYHTIRAGVSCQF